MKIDVHVHTKKTKRGDAPTRNISPEEFNRIVTSTEVKVLAITNHNVFDKQQYDHICANLDEGVQVWPGVELDIVENRRRGHLLVIVAPKKASDFSAILNSLTDGFTPDTFNIGIEKTLDSFDQLGPIYIAHYHQKKPDLTDEDVNIIIEKTANKCRVLKEVSNAISAGIFIGHGRPSIYGSDIHDWGKYEERSRELPELRLPVESFEHFCLLLEKDPQTINTILDKKTPENLSLKPFEDNTQVKLKCYNDINIFFGSKGTGKSKILEAIARHYNDKGIGAKVFHSGRDKLDDEYDLKGVKYSINLEHHGINYCTDQIAEIKKAEEADVVSLESYRQYFAVEMTNKNAKKILFKDFEAVDEKEDKRKFETHYGSLRKLDEFTGFLLTDQSIRNVSTETELNEIVTRIGALQEKLQEKCSELFISWKQGVLLNSAIKSIKGSVAKKTGTPVKPTSTGLREYAFNRICVEANIKELLLNMRKTIDEDVKYVGVLGKEKGTLCCNTKVVIQTGKFTNAAFSPIAKVKKSTQKLFSEKVKQIESHVYKSDLFEHISNLNDIEDVDGIKSIYELLLFNREFTLNDGPYKPSSGECSMLLLHRELEEDKDVYILDEPEKSLGNDYISDVIVPLINEKAKRGKRIFISTHDANIAVRTLPYNSIYRTHGEGGYKTYVGNPFSNKLLNVDDEHDRIDWKQISMRTLEGGEEAFGERGKIYGNR
jgi:predicted ATPase